MDLINKTTLVKLKYIISLTMFFHKPFICLNLLSHYLSASNLFLYFTKYHRVDAFREVQQEGKKIQ